MHSLVVIAAALLFRLTSAQQSQCSQTFSVGSTNSQPDTVNTLLPNGGSWLEPFKTPITGNLCSVTFPVYGGAAGIPVRPSTATLSLYLGNLNNSDIVAGTIVPYARVSATLYVNQKSLTFKFCGTNAPTSQDGIITFVLTNTGLTNPIALAFSEGAGAGYLYVQGNAGNRKQINSSVTFSFAGSIDNLSCCGHFNKRVSRSNFCRICDFLLSGLDYHPSLDNYPCVERAPCLEHNPGMDDHPSTDDHPSMDYKPRTCDRVFRHHF
ncbi:hypothetical protein HDU98_004573 [Podochytrium sp. JEL0797]|nr:hypothetical protein HDU98_004573 [Podochytrium sp. JEL0797]